MDELHLVYRTNKLEYCYRSLTVLTRSTTKCTTKPVGKKLDTPAIEFEATAFKAAFCSLFFEIPSQPCQHWRTHYIPLSPPLRISFWAWADRRANNTHALPDVLDSRTSGNCCYQSPPFADHVTKRNGGSGDENGSRQNLSGVRLKTCAVDCFYIRALRGACECTWKYWSISSHSPAQLEIKDSVNEGLNCLWKYS